MMAVMRKAPPFTPMCVPDRQFPGLLAGAEARQMLSAAEAEAAARAAAAAQVHARALDEERARWVSVWVPYRGACTCLSV